MEKRCDRHSHHAIGGSSKAIMRCYNWSFTEKTILGGVDHTYRQKETPCVLDMDHPKPTGGHENKFW